MKRGIASKTLRPNLNLLSVIVPAYNCKTIRKDLLNLDKYLKERNRPYEIICVVDGLKNGRDTTGNLAKSIRKPRIKVFFYKNNMGKGYAIRFGMARARGGTIAFIDAGNDLNTTGIGLALEHMRWYKADIIVGSKRHHASRVNYPFKRKILSFIVQRATRFLFGFDLSDTQTGLKVFRREVLEKVLPRMLVKKWAFDLEMLAIAHRLGFSRIYESPVEIQFNPDSNIGLGSVVNFALDYMAIFYRTHLLHYYDDDNQDRWAIDPRLKLKYRS